MGFAQFEDPVYNWQNITALTSFRFKVFLQVLRMFNNNQIIFNFMDIINITVWHNTKTYLKYFYLRFDKKVLQIKTAFSSTVSTQTATNWLCICCELFFEKVVLCEEVHVGWLRVFYTFRVVILFSTSSINFFFHSIKLTYIVPKFWLYVKLQSSIPLTTFSLVLSKSFFIGSPYLEPLTKRFFSLLSLIILRWLYELNKNL